MLTSSGRRVLRGRGRRGERGRSVPRQLRPTNSGCRRYRPLNSLNSPLSTPWYRCVVRETGFKATNDLAFALLRIGKQLVLFGIRLCRTRSIDVGPYSAPLSWPVCGSRTPDKAQRPHQPHIAGRARRGIRTTTAGVGADHCAFVRVIQSCSTEGTADTSRGTASRVLQRKIPLPRSMKGY